jgi:hypothetical protein
MQKLIETNLPKGRYNLLPTIRGDFSGSDVHKAVQNLKVKPTEGLFVYYTGHGAYDPDFAENNISGGHFFNMPNKPNVLRKNLLSDMKDKQAALIVLISDCCNARGQFPTLVAYAPSSVALEEPVLSTLLLRHRGVVDITSSKKGEYSFTASKGNEPDGSEFTNSFLNVCAMTSVKSSEMTWEKAFELMVGQTSLRTESRQNPIKYQLSATRDR